MTPEATKRQINVPVMADLAARNESPEILFWVGCAGAFDDRYKRVTRAFVRILEHVGTTTRYWAWRKAAPATRPSAPATSSCFRCRP